MTNWRQELDEVFKSKGFEKKLPELSAKDGQSIQEFLDNIGKPAFENISDQLNSFNDVKAEVEVSKRSNDTIIEDVELHLFKQGQPKLAYRVKFTKRQEHIFIEGEYSIPNIYGENTRYHKTSLEQPLADITEEELAADIAEVLRSRF